MHRGLQGLPEPGAVGIRQWVMLAVIADRSFATPDLATDLDVLPRSCEWLGERDAVPTLDDLRPGHTEPQDEPAAGQVVDGQRSHRCRRGRARGQLHESRAE